MVKNASVENARLEKSAPVCQPGVENVELNSVERRKCTNEHNYTVNKYHTLA